MLEVKGFQGVRYNPAKVGLYDYVITPPYDVISTDERRHLAALSPFNLVHLILPEEREFMTRYESAADYFRTWLAHGVLQRDDTPGYYLLRQHFTDVQGVKRVRQGFLGVAKLPEPGERYILGHERTFNKPVEDRLRLTEATNANLGPVFALYSDPAGALRTFLAQMEIREPDMVAHTIDQVRQELWRVPESPEVNAFLAGKTLYIADGHHRFQTACTYRDNLRKKHPGAGAQPYDYALMGFVALEDAGLEIYPTHRLVPRPEGFNEADFLAALAPYFDIAPAGGDLARALENAPEAACAIGLAIAHGGEHLLTLKSTVDRAEFLGTDRATAWRDLDVAVLHRGILEKVLHLPEGSEFTYEKQAAKAVSAARGGSCGLAFLLRATRKDQICACADAGEPMPQKSTYFFPKLPSGTAINLLD